MITISNPFKELWRHYRVQKARQRYEMLAKMIDSIDNAFQSKGIPRKARKQFWNDFINSPENRKQFIRAMGMKK